MNHSSRQISYPIVIVVILILIIHSYQLPQVQCQENIENNTNHCIGIGFGYATGDATLLEIPPLVSASYSYSFSRFFQAEFLYSYLGTVSINQSGISTVALLGIGSLAETSMATFFQISGIVSPLSDVSGFKIGIGVSMRNHKYAYFDSVVPLAPFQDSRIHYLIDYRFGIHGLVEYQVLAMERCSLHIRGQFTWFFPAFAGSAFSKSKEYINFPQSAQDREAVDTIFQSLIQIAPYSVSLGAFLHINF